MTDKRNNPGADSKTNSNVDSASKVVRDDLELDDADIGLLFGSLEDSKQSSLEVPASMDEAILAAALQSRTEVQESPALVTTKQATVSTITEIESGRPDKKPKHHSEHARLSRVWPQFFAAAAVLVLAITVVPLLTRQSQAPVLQNRSDSSVAASTDASTDASLSAAASAAASSAESVAESVPTRASSAESAMTVADSTEALNTIVISERSVAESDNDAAAEFEEDLLAEGAFESAIKDRTLLSESLSFKSTELPDTPAEPVAVSVDVAAPTASLAAPGEIAEDRAEPSVSVEPPESGGGSSADAADLVDQNLDANKKSSRQISLQFEPASAPEPEAEALAGAESAAAPKQQLQEQVGTDENEVRERRLEKPATSVSSDVLEPQQQQEEMASLPTTVNSIGTVRRSIAPRDLRQERSGNTVSRLVSKSLVPNYRASAEDWRDEVVDLIAREEITRAKIEYSLLRKRYPDFKPGIQVPWENNNAED